MALKMSESKGTEQLLKSLAQNEYRKLESRAKKEAKPGDDREKTQVFIVNWAAQRPKSEDKVS